MAAYIAGSTAGLLSGNAFASPAQWPPRQPGTSAVIRWNDALGLAIAATRTAPTVAARAISMAYEAAYNAWASYDGHALFTLPSMWKRPPMEWSADTKSIAVGHAMRSVLIDLFPSQAASFEAALRETMPGDVMSQSHWRTAVQVGQLAGAALLQIRHTDGSNQLGDRAPGAYADYTGYASMNSADSLVDPLRWQPLRVPDGRGGFVVQKCLTPHWGLVRPFSMFLGSELRPTMDHARPTAEELEELVFLSANLTDEQKSIAEYWAGGPGTVTPPGMWTRIAQEVSRSDQNSLDRDVIMFFAVGQALLDAGIAAWDAKRAYDSCRPLPAVRLAYKGKIIRAWGGSSRGTQFIRGEDWAPYQPATFPTPPFPEFVSGHSTFSAAAAEVLKGLRGDFISLHADVAAGSSEIEPETPARPITLHWASLSEAADSAAMSRRYGGIHFKQGDLKGRELGKRVGQRVLAKCLQLVGGARPSAAWAPGWPWR